MSDFDSTQGCVTNEGYAMIMFLLVVACFAVPILLALAVVSAVLAFCSIPILMIIVSLRWLITWWKGEIVK